MNKIIGELDRSKMIYLISHINPDGDSIGSLVALGSTLKEIYKDKVILIKSDNIPRKFNFLTNIETLSDLNVLNNIRDNSVLITLDCGDISRIGEAYNYIDKFKKIINIDHHISNTNFGDINIIKSDASSTGEIVFDIIKENNLLLNKDIANALYTAISTDTGSFIYDNTTSKTHRIVAELLDYDIDKDKIIYEIYQNRSMEKTNIFIQAIKHLEFFSNNRIGITVITKKMMNETNAKSEDLDGIVEFIRDTDGVEIACVIKELENDKVKVSLRSKSRINVSEIAEIFSGGGHIRAAGYTIESNVEVAKNKVLKEIIKRLR
ncbi:bifunctional oligoribonuclease/PAP phosphatase NrnA [Clostridium sp. D2Q-11]|uniref:Bifunctional oligoribonuclease/PAP phosphatase NrnA n=1 Tax=Anaeromonas frigoriresistens TaxID=2683708 RepID=A0A942UWJ1_9FIRM|nr:bifunctional oligoribonuclease/PAP phosphatase NrnA [Anaeromonas frigoriresistens]MBS4539893.1 bifunctional oligoribonuclease/PAP phosphatase NrnA [Anaeromonas frigoriresistens]